MKRNKKNKYPYPVGWIAYAGILAVVCGYKSRVPFMFGIGIALFLFSFLIVLCRKGDKDHIGFDNDV